MAKRKSDGVVTFTAPPELKKALEQLAEDEERSMSYLVRKAVEKYLVDMGYLSSPVKKRTADQDDNQS